jgi:hypothetical protein
VLPSPPTMTLPGKGLEVARGEGNADGNAKGFRWCIGFEYTRFDADFM